MSVTTTEKRQGTPQQPQAARLEAAASPNPYEDPAEYLKSKAWRCIGNPDWESARWIDPTKPLADEYTKIPLMTTVPVKSSHRDPATGKMVEKVEYREEQLTVQDGLGNAGRLKAEQTLFTPKVTPVSMQEALMIQLERDAAEGKSKA